MTSHIDTLVKVKIIQDTSLSTDLYAKLKELGVSKSTFYRWRKEFREHGIKGLQTKSTKPKRSPNSIPPNVRRKLYRLAKMDRYKDASDIHRKLISDGHSISHPTVIKLLKNHKPPLYGRVVGIKKVGEYPRKHYKTGLANNGYTLIE